MKITWILVRTKLHQEEAVMCRVQALPGFRALLPRGKIHDLLFPGYLFVALPVDKEELHTVLAAVRNVTGISRVAMQGKSPVTIPNTWVEMLATECPGAANDPTELTQLTNISSAAQRTLALITLLSRGAVNPGNDGRRSA